MSPRRSDASIRELASIIERMDALGKDAEDAAARIHKALHATPLPTNHMLSEAIGDVIAVVTERSRLAHQAHRLVIELRREAIAHDRDSHARDLMRPVPKPLKATVRAARTKAARG